MNLQKDLLLKLNLEKVLEIIKKVKKGTKGKKGEKGEKGKKDEKGEKGHENKIDLIVCLNIDDLCLQLQKYSAAKEAGNPGVDNYIIAILDKLLDENAIDRDEYNNFFI